MARRVATLRTQWIGKLLRELREERGVKLADAADHVRRSLSVLSRMELGALPFLPRDIEELLDLYGVVDQERRDAILRLHAQSGEVAWWDVFNEEVTDAVIDLAWFESIAYAIRIYSATVIDGLLQTGDYARAVEAGLGSGRAAADRQVEMRLMRQAVLSRRNPPDLEVILDEAVLRRQVGGPEVMAGQLRHLLDLVDRFDVGIQVLPLEAGAHASPNGGFRLMELPPPLTEVATVSCPLGQLFLEPPHIAPHAETYARLQEAALGPRASVALIEAVVEHQEQPCSEGEALTDG